MKFEIKKALSIQAFDVFFNGVFISRFERKWQAKEFITNKHHLVI